MKNFFKDPWWQYHLAMLLLTPVGLLAFFAVVVLLGIGCGYFGGTLSLRR